MAAVSNVIPFGLLFMRPLQWCLKTKGVLPEGKPALHDQGHAAMPTCLGHVEKTLVLVSEPGAGSSLSPRMLLGKGVVHRILRCPSLLGALGRLACQPCRCFRAQRSPASPHLSLPPGNVAELGSSPPLWGSLQQLVRLSPAGHPLQDTELAAHTRGQSRETERGYRIQFGAPPPPFYGISTVVSPEQGLVMEQEVETLLRKEATEVVPPHVRESGFYSRYFIVPGKDGVVSQIRSEDWFVTVDLKDTYFHVSILPQHMKFLRFAFTGKAYQYRVLLRTTYLGVVWDSTTMQARLSPARFESILCHESERRPVTHCKAVPATAGSDGSCVQCDTFWPAVTRQCLRALDMWKKPWFLSQGPVLGAPCHRVTLATDASLTGWGAVMSGHPARGLWSSRHLTWHISCLEMLAVFRALKHFLPDLIGHHVLVRTDNTAVDKLLSLRAVHVPGHLNMGADILSRQGLRPGEWMLHPPWGLVQMWPRLRLYAFPLIALLPGAGVLEFVGVAPEGAHLIAPGLSTEVVETILQSRAPSSRKLYALKWKPFTSWCGDCQQDSVNCPVGTVLRFLQVQFSTGLAHSTLKVYVAAISAYHAPLGGSSVGWNPLVTRFLRGALRPRPLAMCSLLSVVGMLFHSFESSDLPFLGVKALFS
ncbi:Retrovirus-related Pol polyprotein from transposon 17.6 [Labeo rohita]|uniref:Retrovirus-related Pol polyprotein from transposon 17.6 n=1 Tax=Labeo rohita TaxID=84645 RepID=A0ABQ8L3Z0_LABRO|nr:Retrovirus-related Pol polyprotein from transposon 17.6 [Labeo rohita]